MKSHFSSSILITSLLCSAPAMAHEVSQAKIVELSLHRIERLVILSRIDASFLTEIQSLKLDLIPHSDEVTPAFKVTALQGLAQDGTRRGLELVMNADGKALSQNGLAGSAPTVASAWTDKDAVTLTENSLHYVLDNVATTPSLAPIDANLTEVNLTHGTNAAGQAVAVAEFKTAAQQPGLRVRVKLDGTWDSAEAVAPSITE